MKNLKYNFKVKVNPQESAELQEAAFKAGFSWAGPIRSVQYPGNPFLYINQDGRLGTGSRESAFKNNPARRTTVTSMLAVLRGKEETTVKITKSYKVIVDTALISKKLQKACFDNGILWPGDDDRVQFTGKPYLYIDRQGIRYGQEYEKFREHHGIQVSPMTMLSVLHGRKPEPKDQPALSLTEYAKLQLNLCPGDIVKVVNQIAGYTGGWKNDWCLAMSKTLDNTYEVVQCYDSQVKLDTTPNYQFPYHALELVRRKSSVPDYPTAFAGHEVEIDMTGITVGCQEFSFSEYENLRTLLRALPRHLPEKVAQVSTLRIRDEEVGIEALTKFLAELEPAVLYYTYDE